MDDQRISSITIRSHRRERLIACHPEVDIDNTSLFRMKVVKCHRSALTRMLHEAILVIKGEGVLLNAKEEYSRTLLPRLRWITQEDHLKTYLPQAQSSIRLQWAVQ